MRPIAKAGDLVEWTHGDRDPPHPSLLFGRHRYVQDTVNTVGVWFEPVGRLDPRELVVVQQGAWLSRVDYWAKRYPW